MKVMFLDLETTGLRPRLDQVLEIGCAWVDLSAVLWEHAVLSTWTTLVRNDPLTGEPSAFAMHTELLRELDAAARGSGAPITTPMGIEPALGHWLTSVGADCDSGPGQHPYCRVTLGGKNVGTFDAQFLLSLPAWGQYVRFRHRVIEVSTLWARSIDTEPPDMAECCKRAGLGSEVVNLHRALPDALLAARLAWIALQEQR